MGLSGPVTFREETASDAPAIHDLLVAAFPSDAEARLVTALRSRGAITLSLVALRGDRVVGYLVFSEVSIASEGSEAHQVAALGLGPMAVLPPYQNQGSAPGC